MICSMDATGFCARHGVIHQGAAKELALDPGPDGEAFRAKCDDVVRRGVVRRQIDPSKPKVSIADLAGKRRRCGEAKAAGRPCTEFN